MRRIKQYTVFLICLGCLVIHLAFNCFSDKSELEYDHIVLFAKDKALKDSLNKYFTPAEKLTTTHDSQGTVGYYYLFYNTYIELLFLEDSTIARQNTERFGSDYLVRWNSDSSSPVGFGMIYQKADSNPAGKSYHKYYSKDSPEGEYYLMSVYNANANQPMVYASLLNRSYEALESIEDINQRPEQIRKDLKKYLTHSSGVRKVTEITYTYTNELEKDGNIGLLNDNPETKVKKADLTSLILVFDNAREKKKEFWSNDKAKLILYF